jgi:hypothetical protein
MSKSRKAQGGRKIISKRERKKEKVMGLTCIKIGNPKLVL